MLISGPGQLSVRLIEDVRLIRGPPNRGFTVFTIALHDILVNRALQMSPQTSQEEGKNQKHQNQVLMEKLQEKILDMTMKVPWMGKK